MSDKSLRTVKALATADLIPAERIHPIHNGVPAEFLEHEWRPGVHRDPRPALFFGRFARSKGVDVLLRALRELGDEAPPVRLVGSRTYRVFLG